MKTVRILKLHGKGEIREVGRIRWDGRRFLVDGKIAEGMLHQPLTFVQPPLTAADGEKFLNGLQYQYKSAYLLATSPE